MNIIFTIYVYMLMESFLIFSTEIYDINPIKNCKESYSILFGCCYMIHNIVQFFIKWTLYITFNWGLIIFYWQVVWEHLYKIESGRDVGTLYYFRNLFRRNNVKQKVKDGFAPAQDLFV